MNDLIQKEITLKANIDKVWNAISRAEEISKWFLEADFKAEKDYKYTFKSEGENCDAIFGVVKSADPYQLIYSWIVSGTEVETIVEWNLEPFENGTKLMLKHSGISNYAGTDVISMFESFNGGWDNCFAGLSKFVD